MPTPSTPKQIVVKIRSSATTKDPVKVLNNTTGEIMTKDRISGDLLRTDGKAGDMRVLINVDNFVQGWTVNDVLTVVIGGTTAVAIDITLTAKTLRQKVNVTAVAVSTAALSI